MRFSVPPVCLAACLAMLPVGRAADAHWAFQPVANPAVPLVKDAAWAKTDVDRFILAKLEAAGLAPAAPADKRTLLRRATFDLTGLPPTVEELAAFIADESPDAFAKVVDRLLASPRYGERWGRHWLDLARYADTKGYVYAREERFFVHAHTYRDWVIRALNDDLPYDRFLMLQIAADQLVAPDSPDLAAMGFLTGGRRFIGVTHDIIDDRIDVVTRGAMALTVACARCHDHKYDPVPIEDYYALYGVFHNAAERLVRLPAATTDAAFEKEYAARAKKLADQLQRRRDEAAGLLRARVGEYLAAQLELKKYPEEGFDQILTADDLSPASVRRWRDFLHQCKDAAHPIFGAWHALAKVPAGEVAVLPEGLNPLVAAAFAEPPKSMREAAERYGALFTEAEKNWQTDAAAGELHCFLHDPHSPTSVPDVALVDNELFFPTNICEELWKYQAQFEQWSIQAAAAPPHALILVDREPEPDPRVFKRGSPARPGDEVPRRFPGVVAGPGRAPFSKGSGRLELAQAIASADNPLTARVMVNRIWQHHFGAGLVRTPSDFGVRSEPPSHPELLDWLARRFVESGWSVKAMHRLILSSAAWQQSAGAHFPRRRLDFEQLRDALLAASGELDVTMGGKPSDLFANKRRSIYGLVDRQFLPGTFRVFDFANPDLHLPQRHETSVPQQALFFLNSGFVAARAKALAARGAPTAEERVTQLWKAVHQRGPTDREMASGLGFIAEAAGDGASLGPWEQYAQVLLLSNEFLFVD